MTAQTTRLATTANLLIATLYAVPRISRWTQRTATIHLGGIALASLVQSTRSYTESKIPLPHDATYLGTSLAIMALASRIAGLSTRENALSTLAFGSMQLASYHFAHHYSHKAFETEAFERAGVSRDELVNLRNNTLEAGNHLVNQLFPVERTLEYSGKRCQASLFVVPGGFMLFLSPEVFSFTHTADGSEIERLWTDTRHSIKISDDAHAALQAAGPWKCQMVEGRWQEIPNPDAGAIDWDTLILGNSQEQPLFTLVPVADKWTPPADNPNLNGVSFSHSQVDQVRFKFWIHERRTNVLQAEINSLPSRMTYLENVGLFLDKFEEAKRHPPENWQSLAGAIPFKFLRERYADQEDFLADLQREGHFVANRLMVDAVQEARRESLVDGRGYIDIAVLERWKKMVARVQCHFPPDPLLDTLIANTNEYTQINRTLADRNQRRTAPESYPARRDQLAEKLKDGYAAFFNKYVPLVERRKEFAQHLAGDLQHVQRRTHQLTFYQYCESPPAAFAADLATLQSWTDLILWIHEQRLVELNGTPLLNRCQECARLSQQVNRLTGRFEPTGAEEAELAQARNDLQALVGSLNTAFQDFFANPVPPDLLEPLAKQVKAPRSHTSSTAQIEFYAPIGETDLQILLIGHLRDQLVNLITCLDRQPDNSVHLPPPLFDQFQAVYKAATQFVLRKEAALAPERGNRFDPATSPEFRQVLHLLEEVIRARGDLYTHVNMVNEAAYREGLFVRKEVEHLEELISFANDLIYQMKTPIRWGDHERIHKDDFALNRIRTALTTGGNWEVYKRITESGNILFDLVPAGKESYLERLDEVHTSIGE